MARNVLIKPILTEKSDLLSNDLNKYTFIVDRKANKVEIRKAVEKIYSVSVDSVNTLIMPGKKKVRYTKTGLQRGSMPSVKKAIVTLSEGETIDFYDDL